MYDSYIAIRKAIGILGMSLPILVIGLGAAVHLQVADSLSGYYHTSVRDVFVSVLFASGLLLMVYQGSNPTDRHLTTAAGFLAILVVVFPTQPVDGAPGPIGIFLLTPDVSWICHLVSAFSFFGLMGFICLFRFTRHDSKTPADRIRLNFRYKVCGLFIVIGAVFTLTIKLCFRSYMQFYPVLVAESVILAAIGYGWFLKGDKTPRPAEAE